MRVPTKSALFASCLLSLSSSLTGAQSEPLKLAGSARFDLNAEAGVLSLDDCQVIAGNGSIERPNWVAEDQRARAYTVNFPVSRLGWRELKVRFTPRGSGEVTLTLMGRGKKRLRGIIYRQEVLWDAFDVDGANLADRQL